MKLAGMFTKSAGYPLDDPALMVGLAIHSCLKTCEVYGVEPVGAFEMSMHKSVPYDDMALRWQFTADEPDLELR